MNNNNINNINNNLNKSIGIDWNIKDNDENLVELKVYEKQKSQTLKIDIDNLYCNNLRNKQKTTLDSPNSSTKSK